MWVLALSRIPLPGHNSAAAVIVQCKIILIS
jgi:hypothetical protein